MCSMALRSWPRLPVLFRASIAEIEEAGEAEDDGPQYRRHRRGNQIASRHLRIGRQSVDFRSVHQQVERVQPAVHLLVGAVEIRPVLPRPVELLHPRSRSLSKLADGPKLDRLGRAGFRAGGLHPALQPVVTERALLRRLGDRVDVDHAERTGRDAVAAAIASVHWMTTVSNSVRMIAPVGQTSRQAAWTQCLHTSLISSHRPSFRSSANCSTNLTWRQWMPSSLRVLS